MEKENKTPKAAKQPKESVFEVLNAINCNEHIEKKNGLSYLSWAWAWSICKKHYPNAFYTIYERENGIPYFTDGKTCWVKTGVTVEGQEHIEFLPIMDYRNVSIPLEKVTSMDMNKAIQRSLTKALARHGLGLYIYAGEDLPDGDVEGKPTPKIDIDAYLRAVDELKTTNAIQLWWSANKSSIPNDIVQTIYQACKEKMKELSANN